MNTNEKQLKFSDIIGYEKEKEELKEIQKFILEIDKYEEIGARIPKGILLVGESGNGKTLMAKALASEINIPFYSIGDEIDDDETVKSIREVFKQARENSPCVVFIDELDKFNTMSMCGSPFEEPESSTVRELLTQMDGFQTNSGIIVIATANVLYNLNPSLLRSGRFDRIIDIRMPNKNERKELFEYYAKSKKIEENVDFEKMAIRTSGICCADVDNILNDAALISIREGKDKISVNSIETAVDRVLFGSATEKKLSEETRKKVAMHEVGHAVVSIALGNKDLLTKISIISRGKTMGFNRFVCDDDFLQFGYTDKESLLKKLKTSLGGVAIEENLSKSVSTGCTSDIDKARKIISSMVEIYGMYGVDKYFEKSRRINDESISQNKKVKIEKLEDNILNKALKETKKILKDNMNLVNALYNRLMECNVIYKEEIDEIIESFSNKGEK